MSNLISSVIDDRAVVQAFRALERFSDNPQHLLEEIGQSYERRVLENFSRESDPEGNPWEKLSSTTLMLKLARGKRLKKKGTLSKKGREYLQGKRLLVESGALRRNVHYQADRNSVRIGVGGSVPYGAIHQRGGMAGRGKKVKIPARAYLAMNDGAGMRLAERDRSMVLQLTYRHLDNVVGGKR